MDNKKKYLLNVDMKLFKQLKKKAKKEYKLVNPKIVELILAYVRGNDE